MRRWIWHAWCGCALALATAAHGWDDLTAMSDEFDRADTLPLWQRIHQTEGWGNDDLEAFDSNTTRPGHLVMMPYTSSWFAEWRGELTYKPVTGDFVITTFVEPRNRAGTGRPERDFSLAGIMVRVPRAMTNYTQWTANGQNYVFLSMGSANRLTPGYEFEVKTTSNSTSTLFIEGTPANRAAIQVARLGPHLIMLRRIEGGEWVVHRRYYRPDFPATLQAGLTVYTDWDVCFAVGPENNNRLVLTNGAPLLYGGTVSGAQPDLVASFDYVRYARPAVPPALVGADFSNPGAVTDGQLLSFLGEPANIPGGAAAAPVFHPEIQVDENGLITTAHVTSQRTYRVQMAADLNGTWSNLFAFVSTGDIQRIELPVPLANTQGYFRAVSP